MLDQMQRAATSPSGTPTAIIAAYTDSAPVDVYRLAQALGLSVVEERLEADISGKIERLPHLESYLVTVNANHSETRRRFTVAHEIAHFVLHRNLIGDGITDDALYRSAKGDEIERQANSYAATILMPAPLVRTTYRNGARSYVEMAKTFGVSPEVARIRMAELRLGA